MGSRIGALLFACQLIFTGSAIADDGGATKAGPLPERYRPIPCDKDADCHSPACGPCKTGERLEADGPSCFVNPCPEVPVIRARERICVVK
jgi:hypothetical protein